MTNADRDRSDRVSVEYEPANARGLQNFSIFTDGRWIGAGALVFLPQGRMCYLKWIFIDGRETGRGYGSAALRTIFADLADRGMERIDTDTADGNQIAGCFMTRSPCVITMVSITLPQRITGISISIRRYSPRGYCAGWRIMWRP